MRFLKQHLLVLLAVPSIINVKAQFTDTTTFKPLSKDSLLPVNTWKATINKRQFAYKSLLVPGVLFVYGLSSLESNQLKSFNAEMKEEIWQEHPHKRTTIDNYLLYSPAVAVYGLNALGIKGKNNFRDRTMIYLISNAITNSTVFGLKKITHELRPDGTDYYSFPSGHTAEAFASAEFLRQEYKDISPWYGIAGYAAAGATGVLRMYNNRHWMSDVLAGAGVGIASTKLAYWIYPSIKRKLFKDKPMNAMIMPYYQSGGAGLAMVYKFH
ncbi:MAG: phosphatase PAP2 family protein [Ferruginibacter sp.]